MKALFFLFATCMLLNGVRCLMKVTGGSVVALVTPMTPSNAVDIKRFTNLLEWHAQQGTSGAVILGTTGGEWQNVSLIHHWFPSTNLPIDWYHWLLLDHNNPRSHTIPLFHLIRGKYYHSTGEGGNHQVSCSISRWEDANYCWYWHHRSQYRH